MDLGAKIRKIRKEKKMTLVELSSLTGVAQASLSRIETGIMRGTVASHQKIAEALGTTIAELYGEIDSKLDEIEHRKEAQTQEEAVVKESNVRLEVLTAQLEKRKFAPVLITLPSGSSVSFEALERGTDKFFWIASGNVNLNLNKKDYPLNINDTIYFDASYSHTLKNTATGESRIFSVTSPASF